MTRTIPHFELLRRIRARDLSGLRGEAVEVRCDRLSAVLYRDVADLALAAARVGPVVWRDARGREEPAASGVVAAGRLAAQTAWHVPRALLGHRRRLRRLRHRGPVDSLTHPGRLLYLRTDHAFDVEAGGSVAHVAGVVGALRAGGVEVDVVSTDRVPGVADEGLHEVVPEYGPLRNVRDLAHMEYDRQLRGWLEARRHQLKPDVVYHRHALYSTIGPWLQRDWGVPFVCEYNGSFAWMSRHWDDATVFFPRLLDRAERLTLASADLVVTVSDALRDDAVQRGADPDRVVVEPNAVDPERYRPDADQGAVRAGYGIPPDAVLVGFIGTFGPWHGGQVLARAAARLLSSEPRSGHGGVPGAPDLHFLFIGEGMELPVVEGIVEDAGIGDRVTLTGLVPQARGPAHLAACDILVSPHVPNPDGSPFFGSPTKLFEYMATGRAIVASELTQIGEVLEHDRTAVLVPPGNVNALASAIAALAEDPERRARLGHAARQRVLERHTWAAHTGRVLSAMAAARRPRATDRTTVPGGTGPAKPSATGSAARPYPRLDFVRRVLSMPPREVVGRSIRVAATVGHDLRQRFGHLRGGDLALPDAVYHEALFGARAVLPVVWTAPPGPVPLEPILESARQVLDHRFDLLGSGPVMVNYSLQAAGLDGHRYRGSPGPEEEAAQRDRMNAFLDEPVAEYSPIDWHIDFKSGYRWDPDRWFGSIRYGRRPGVDVKVPWELSRFQHAGVLGLAHRLAPASEPGGRAAREFKLQVVDWLAANPVRRGVNWAVAMDVALRAVNWLAGAALLGEAVEADARFRRLLVDALVLHGRHIEANLEYDPGRNGNHYVANLLGLVAIGAALPGAPEADRWVVYGLQELESEIRKQVLPDGVDVEGSTAYHGFVGEMFAIAAAIAARIPDRRRQELKAVPGGAVQHPLAPHYRGVTDQRFDLDRGPVVSPGFLRRLRAMAVVTAEVTKPDGLLPQIGDNDSGRVLRLGPQPDPRDWRILPAMAGRMFADDGLETAGAAWSVQAGLVVPARGAFSSGNRPDPAPAPAPDERPNQGVVRVQPPARDEAAAPAHSRDGIVAFPDGGVIIGRAADLYLAVHAGLLSPTSPGGHFHNDLLSFELQWAGTDIVVDPGSFVYTPLPDARDAYRATAAHSTVAVRGREQRLWPPQHVGLFAIEQDAGGVTLDRLESDCIAVTCRYGGVTHERSWQWTPRRLDVVDRVTTHGARATAFLNLAPGVEVEDGPTRNGDAWNVRLRADIGPIKAVWTGVEEPRLEGGLYSIGYGRQEACEKIGAPLRGDTARLTLERVS